MSEINFEEVISRVKVALSLTDDKDLAELMEMSTTAFSNRRKKGSLPYEQLTKLLTSRNVDLKWIFTGSLDSAHLRNATMAAMEVAMRYSPVEAELVQEMQRLAFDERLTADQLAARFGGRLPAFLPAAGQSLGDYQVMPRGRVTLAGERGEIESDQLVDHLAVRREWMRRVLGINHVDVALVELRDNSMAATLQDGDLVLTDLRQNRLDGGAVFVIRSGQALVVKRLQRNLSGQVLIKSDNPAYETETLDAEQLARLEIVGRVVWPRLR